MGTRYPYIGKQLLKGIAMTTIKMKDVLPSLTTAAAIGHRNLTLVPLRGEGHQLRFQNYMLAAEAINAGLLTVTEIDESGSVPELLAVNDADNPVLLIDGEELQGAKQNRIMDTSILLAGKSKTRIPVACVEQGRWSHTSREFKTGNYTPSKLRQRKSCDVKHCLEAGGVPHSDQSAVWNCVDEALHHCHMESPTAAMSDAMDSQTKVLDRYRQALPYPSGACGVVAAVDGQFIAADAFDSPATLEVIWPRLIASYAMDAETAKAEADADDADTRDVDADDTNADDVDAKQPASGEGDAKPASGETAGVEADAGGVGQPANTSAARNKTAKTFSAKAAEVLLEHIAEQRCQTFETVGLGQDLRFETNTILGQALEAENHLLHLSVFPSTNDRHQSDHNNHRISPPSRRRR